MKDKLIGNEDQSKEHIFIDGHHIVASFSENPNNDVYQRIRSILLNMDEEKEQSHIRKKKKEAVR